MSDRALVVDDSSFQRTIVSNTIEDWFDIVATAENGKEAIEQFKKERPDVVTMDIMMPEMDGITAVKNIKEISPETIIVMVTSVKQKQKMREAAKAGADGYVTKPVNTKKLRDEFADVLDWPAASQDI
ncbi:response regulator [Halohasta litorea]|uniref:Response regulator n=1 Tax=Halohasta litorea TaxID=869891 RepID=A0ABD6D6I8_9EURY|nr:response regulator [Halohasta litorea]MEA1932557.1 response regulator [Euryarchaeota archaeon]